MVVESWFERKEKMKLRCQSGDPRAHRAFTSDMAHSVGVT